MTAHDNVSQRDIFNAALSEYKELQANIRQFTDNSMRIKNWSVTIGLAGIVAAFIQKQPAILLLSPVTTILFWAMDARWRAYLVCFIERQKEIEKYFLGELQSYEGPQINRSFDKTLDKMKSDWSTWIFAKSTSIHIPHSLVIIVAISVYILVSIGAMPFPK